MKLSSLTPDQQPYVRQMTRYQARHATLPISFTKRSSVHTRKLGFLSEGTVDLERLIVHFCVVHVTGLWDQSNIGSGEDVIHAGEV